MKILFSDGESTARFLRLTCAVLVVASLARSVFAQADGSPRWPGPFTTGGPILSSPAVGADGAVYIGSQDKYLYAINANGTLRWRFLTGDWVDSSPAIAPDGTIYFGSWDGKIYALNPNGTKKWEYSAGIGNYVYSSPALGADGTVYIGAGDGNFHALRPDGTLKWSYPAGDWIDASPAIGANGLIYYASWDGYVYAVRDNGSSAGELWRFDTAEPVLASPALGRDGTVYIGGNDGRLYALHGSTGAKRWEFATGVSIEASAAVGPDGTIYIGSDSGSLFALNPDGTQRWKFNVGQPIVSTPAVRGDGTIIFGAGDNAVYALTPNGAQKWKFTTEDWVDSSPVVASTGHIYFGSYDRKIYALNGTNAALSSLSPWPAFRGDPPHSGRVSAGSPGGRLINLATRAQAGPGFNLIPGFVVQGGSGSTYLVRAVGPTLAQLGVPETLADPKLDLITGAATVAQNDDWSSAGSATLAAIMNSVGAFALAPGSKDAAVHVTLSAGQYTAHVGSTGPASGVALVEVYDAAVIDTGARLVNLSTRAHAGIGANVLTPGLVIGGSSLRVLIRAVGPSLQPFGVTGVLAQPSLALFSGAASVGTNTGWTTSGNAADLRAAAQLVGGFPLIEESADSALLVTLSPGAHTVQVSGVGGTTGEALVEVYVVP
ncbi:MAG: PQQ-binding-like beta-propeller repeat protein [Opitutaceae bacterium]